MRSRETVIAVVAGICLAAVGLAYYYDYHLKLRPRPWPLFVQERNKIDELIKSWAKRPPPGVEERWSGAWEIAYNGFGNVCCTPEHVSLAEMYRLKADVQAKMREPATMASVRWFWNRLAETGPHGKQYIEQMTPGYKHVFE
jgi:hypothetical protein